MKKLCLCIIFLFAVVGVKAQSVECPQNMVCITREAAQKALADGDKVIALTAENTTLKDAIEGKDGYKALLAQMRIDFARVSGELTSEKEHAVRMDAVLDLALKHTQKSCKPFSVCF